MKLLVDPEIRTRCLYRWEDDFTFTGNVKFTSEKQANLEAQGLWEKTKWNRRHSCPKIELRKIKSRAWCYGRELIVLTLKDRKVTDLIHELTHARGYGGDKNPHNVSFVWTYLELVCSHFNLKLSEMIYQAKERGLV